MAPTGKVAAKPIAKPTPQPSSIGREVKRTVPPPEYFLLTNDTDTAAKRKAIYNNLQDFKLTKCSKYSIWCKVYVAEPENELTCKSAIERYGLDQSEVTKLGLLENLCDGSDRKTNASIKLPKDYFEQLLAKYQN